MSEHGKFLQMIVGMFQLVGGAEQRLAAAAIEDVFRFDRRFFTANSLDVDLRAIVAEFDLLHFRFLANLGAALARVIQQELVEFGTRDLIGAVTLRTKSVLEIEFYAACAACGHDFAAKLGNESPIELLAHAEPVERL